MYLVGVAGAVLSVSSCAPPPTADSELAAAQLAAATEIANGIARNPGPLRTICVAYSGDWADPALPTGSGAVSFAYAEGCEEIDGQLFAQAGASRAIWLGVGEPELSGGSSAEVRVFTSTGVDDAASYLCTLRWTGSDWVVDSCEMGATS